MNKNKSMDILLHEVMPEVSQLITGKAEAEAEAAASHVFSEQFEQKINRLIRQEQSFYYPLINTKPKKVCAMILAVLLSLFTVTMSVKAAREYFFHLIEQIFPTHSKVFFQGEDYGQRNSPFVAYELSWVPEGFILDKENSFCEPEGKMKVDIYRKGSLYINFEQADITASITTLNTEWTDLQEIEHNGEPMYLLEWEDNTVLIWYDNEYSFILTATLGKSDLIKMQEFVKKVE